MPSSLRTYREKIESLLYHIYGVQVLYGPDCDNAYFKELCLVEISTSQSELLQYYTLLHEAGHVIAMEKKDFTYLGESGIILNEACAWIQAEELISTDLSCNSLYESWGEFQVSSVTSYIERRRVEN